MLLGLQPLRLGLCFLFRAQRAGTFLQRARALLDLLGREGGRGRRHEQRLVQARLVGAARQPFHRRLHVATVGVQRAHRAVLPKPHAAQRLQRVRGHGGRHRGACAALCRGCGRGCVRSRTRARRRRRHARAHQRQLGRGEVRVPRAHGVQLPLLSATARLAARLAHVAHQPRCALGKVGVPRVLGVRLRGRHAGEPFAAHPTHEGLCRFCHGVCAWL
mmetsp:Transcript_49507/g.124482  ORF Transcript_49507/g.124482 Transcript_49507/m.124482 type:complete len:218 (-) Transcript_49507:27-680(-)